MIDVPKPTESRYLLERTYLQEPVQYGDVSLIQIGRLHCTPHTAVELHTHLNWFELTVITDGCGIIGTNEKSVRVQSGDIHLSLPGDFHEIRTDTENPMKYDFFSFFPTDPSLLKELETATRYRYPAEKRLFSDERIGYQIRNAVAELNTPSPLSRRILETVFLQIVLYLLNDLQQTDNSSPGAGIGHPNELCFQMMHYIDTHLYTMRSLREVTDSLNYSYSYLSDLFRQVTGDTLQTYYQIRRLESARLLIRERKLKIGEIAELLQYSSIYAFSRAFRNHFGISPKDMRSPK